MEVLVFIIVGLGSLVAIGCGIWVAIALGSAISAGGKENIPEEPESDS